MLAAAKGLIRPRKDALTQDETLDFEPKAVIVWWSRQATDGPARGNTGGLGFAAPKGQASIGWASDDGADPARARSWTSSDAISAVPTTSTATGAARATMAFDERTLRLNWHSRSNDGWLVHYLALGGDELRHAAVIRAEVTTSGSQPVRNLGFRPDCVLLAPALLEKTSSAPGLLAALGAATADSQAGAGFSAGDGISPTRVRGSQRTDSLIVVPVPGKAELGARGVLESMDPDGFTLQWDLACVTGIGLVGLALQGGRYLVGTRSSPVGPRSRQRVRVGFRPSAVLAFSWGLPDSPDTKDIGRFVLGGASPDAAGCTGWSDENRGVRPARTQVWTSPHALVGVPDSRSDRIHGLARLAGFGRRGFLLDWAIRDRSRRQFAYVAFGPHDNASPP